VSVLGNWGNEMKSSIFVVLLLQKVQQCSNQKVRPILHNYAFPIPIYVMCIKVPYKFTNALGAFKKIPLRKFSTRKVQF
jgi:hypothetical protein